MSSDEFIAKLLELAKRPTGTKLNEVAAIHAAWDIAETLVKMGKLFKVKTGHRTVLYFTDKRMADALTMNRPQLTVVARKSDRTPPPQGEPIITEKTKFTRCPPSGAFHVKQLAKW